MGWLRKKAKQIGNVFKKIGKKLKKGLGKIAKAFGKLGPLGSLALSFIIPGVGGQIFNWLKGLGTPDTLEQYKDLAASKEGLTSDVSVILLNSHKNPNIKFTFTNALPIGLTPVSLDMTTQDVTYAEATVTLRYDAFEIENM